MKLVAVVSKYVSLIDLLRPQQVCASIDAFSRHFSMGNASNDAFFALVERRGECNSGTDCNLKVNRGLRRIGIMVYIDANKCGYSCHPSGPA